MIFKPGATYVCVNAQGHCYVVGERYVCTKATMFGVYVKGCWKREFGFPPGSELCTSPDAAASILVLADDSVEESSL